MKEISLKYIGISYYFKVRLIVRMDYKIYIVSAENLCKLFFFHH